MITIASWYWGALIRAINHVTILLRMVFGAMAFVDMIVHMALITFFVGTGASHFLFV